MEAPAWSNTIAVQKGWRKPETNHRERHGAAGPRCADTPHERLRERQERGARGRSGETEGCGTGSVVAGAGSLPAGARSPRPAGECAAGAARFPAADPETVSRSAVWISSRAGLIHRLLLSRVPGMSTPDGPQLQRLKPGLLCGPWCPLASVANRRGAGPSGGAPGSGRHRRIAAPGQTRGLPPGSSGPLPAAAAR
jgi:hypothetical protein